MNTQTFHKTGIAFLTALFMMSQAGQVSAESGISTPEKRLASASTVKTSAPVPSTVQKSSATPPVRLAQAEAGSGAGTENLAKVTSVTAGKDNDQISIKVQSTGTLQYTAFKLMNPLRLVLDFPGMTRSNLGSVIAVNQGVVNSIRPLYFEEAQVLRLEIGLDKAASYEILKPGVNMLDIRLKEALAATTEVASNGKRTKIEKAKTEGEGDSIYESGKSKGKSDSCQDILGGEKEPISLDFQNANIKNIFRIISEVSGFNVVLSPEVSGVANIRLIDVGWNTALELILENSGLGRVCEKNVIRIAPKTTFIADQETERLVTEMIRVNYADIEAMVTNLKGLKSTDRGSITADVRTNTLILTDIQEKVDEMVSVIQTLDVKTPQVLIESKMVEVRRSFAQELGIRWGMYTNRISNADFPSSIRTSGGAGTTPQGVLNDIGFNFRNSIGQPGQIIPFAPVVDLGVPSGAPTGAFGIALDSGDHFVDIQLEALEEQGKSKTIANPKVTTLDNKEALIKSGRKIPYQTTSANEGAKISWVDADIRLTVTPHITADEDIYMKIEARQNSADFDNPTLGGVPTILTKEATTELLVNNGATAVMGGLYQKDTEENKGAVPYLHKIPFLGYLFKNRSQLDDIAELLIFVTPTIVRSKTPSDS